MSVGLDEAVERFADAVGMEGPVTISGTGTRGGPVPGVRAVVAPAGVEWVQAAEMTMRCGAATTMGAVDAALAEFGQCVAIPDFGTIGGALAIGQSSVRRLGWGPVRDTVLQARYVSAAGAVVKAGGPTVKNVSGFDLCRLLVGSRGTLGFLADVILRTRPRPIAEQWFTSERDPWALLGELYRPTSVLWNGTTTWVLLDGHPADVEQRATASGMSSVSGPPDLPEHRWSLSPDRLRSLVVERPGAFIAEIGVGIVHHEFPCVPRDTDQPIRDLHHRIKHEFDPTGRLNPGVALVAPA